MYQFVLKFLHVIGASVLLGTGPEDLVLHASSPPHGQSCHHRRDRPHRCHRGFLFTASAVVPQPATAVLLAREDGYSLWEDWIVFSIVLDVVPCLFCLPVVWMQMVMRRLAEQAAQSGMPLPGGLLSASRRLPPWLPYSG